MPEHQYSDTGFLPIDEEHRSISLAILETLDAVRAVDGARLEAGLLVASKLVADHFAHEERLMAEHGFPKAARHKQAHDAFLIDAAAKIKALRQAGLTDDLRRWVTGRLPEWFRFHIMANDVELGRFLLAHAAQLPPPTEPVEIEVELDAS